MGITRGVEIHVRKVAPLGDPIEITVRGYELSLRKADAESIEVESFFAHKLAESNILNQLEVRIHGYLYCTGRQPEQR